MNVPSATVTIGDEVHILTALTLDQAESIFDSTEDGVKRVRAIVALCLQNGGNANITAENIGAIPYRAFATLQKAALDLNGFSGDPTGEATAPAKA